jgi:hypothetical protein
MSMLLQTALAAEISGWRPDFEITMHNKSRIVSDWPSGYVQTKAVLPLRRHDCDSMKEKVDYT